MAYLKSDKVKVFPSAFRGKDGDKQINPQSFLTLEENYVNIANKVTNRLRNYFFIEGNEVVIVLHGYCFSASKDDIQSPFSKEEGDEIWVGISTGALPMTSYDANENTPVLMPASGGSAGECLDNSGDFKALLFGSESDVNGCNYKIGLFRCEDSEWKPIEKYTHNIDTNQIQDRNDSNKSIDEEFTTDFVHTSSVKTPNIFGEDNLTINASTFSVDATKSVYLSASSLVSLHGNTINLSTFSSSGAGNVEIYGKGIIDLKQNTEIKGNFIPKSHNSYNLGSAESYFKSAFIDSVRASSISATTISAVGVNVANVITTSLNAASSVNANSVYANRFEVNSASTGMMITNYLYAKSNDRALVIGQVQGKADVEVRASTILLNPYSSVVNVTGNIVPVSSSLATLGTNTTSWYAGYISNIHTDTIVGDTSISGNVIPKSAGVYNLGNDSYRWKSVYANELYTREITPPGNYDLYLYQSMSSAAIILDTRGTLGLYASEAINVETVRGPIRVEAGSYASGYYQQNFMVGASDVTIDANHIYLSADASKTYLTKDSVGNSYTPIYLNQGNPQPCTGAYGNKMLSADDFKFYSNKDAIIASIYSDVAGFNLGHPLSFSWNSFSKTGHVAINWFKYGSSAVKFFIDLKLNDGGTLTVDYFTMFNIDTLLSFAGYSSTSVSIPYCTCVVSPKRNVLGDVGCRFETWIGSFSYSNLSSGGFKNLHNYAFFGLDTRDNSDIDGFSMELLVVGYFI